MTTEQPTATTTKDNILDNLLNLLGSLKDTEPHTLDEIITAVTSLFDDMTAMTIEATTLSMENGELLRQLASLHEQEYEGRKWTRIFSSPFLSVLANPASTLPDIRGELSAAADYFKGDDTLRKPKIAHKSLHFKGGTA